MADPKDPNWTQMSIKDHSWDIPDIQWQNALIRSLYKLLHISQS